MELDFQLILTHIVGFVITVWILKKFAWKPLLGIMQERRDKIKEGFDQIESGKQDVARSLAHYESKLKEIETEARQKMNEAIGEGQKVAADLKEQGREEAKEIITRAKAELVRDVEKARAVLKEDMVRMAIAGAEKVISSRLDDSENRRLISEFIDSVEKA